MTLILDFLSISSHLKKVSRQGWIDKLSIDKPESVADHVFSLAIMGMIFSDLENYNTEKILKIILLHDLAESITGDIPPKQISKNEKKEREMDAKKKILNKLPILLQKQYGDLWREYELNSSNEANLVHQLDKLELALQAKIYCDDGYSKEKMKSFFDYAGSKITDPQLTRLFKEITENV